MIQGQKRNFEIGKFQSDAIRKRPNDERVYKYLDSMKNQFQDFDVYLWGSYPDKPTWDVDFLLSNPDSLDTQQMEDLSVLSLNKSLVENNFLADVGFTDKPIVNFNTYRDNYVNNNSTMQNSGYVYADKWFENGRMFKNRSQYNEGRMERMGNNMMRMASSMPYKKMINTINDGTFNNIYGSKPELIMKRRKMYG